VTTGCGTTRTVYVPVPVVPIAENITADTPVPDVPEQMTWGQSLDLTIHLLSALGQCNRDKADIRAIELERAKSN